MTFFTLMRAEKKSPAPSGMRSTLAAAKTTSSRARAHTVSNARCATGSTARRVRVMTIRPSNRAHLQPLTRAADADGQQHRGDCGELAPLCQNLTCRGRGGHVARPGLATRCQATASCTPEVGRHQSHATWNGLDAVTCLTCVRRDAVTTRRHGSVLLGESQSDHRRSLQDGRPLPGRFDSAGFRSAHAPWRRNLHDRLARVTNEATRPASRSVGNE